MYSVYKYISVHDFEIEVGEFYIRSFLSPSHFSSDLSVTLSTCCYDPFLSQKSGCLICRTDVGFESNSQIETSDTIDVV